LSHQPSPTPGPNRVQSSTGTAFWVFALFFLSGALSLVYQVLWSRSLTLILGNSTSAVGLVVAVFMGGLALGSGLGGRLAERLQPARALFWYALLEAGLGLYAALTPTFFERMHHGLAGLAGAEGVPLGWKAAVVGPVLLPPTLAMGATLPLMCRAAASYRSLASSFPLLYGLNTVGAMTGAGLAGFSALPTLGLQTTLFLAAAGNVLVGLLGATLSVRWPSALLDDPSGEGDRESGADARAADSGPGLPHPWLLAAAALSGMAAMAHEITFTRALALVLGSSVYSFSLVLTLFLAGIGLGSLLVRRLPDRLSPALAFAVCQGLMALAVSGLLLYFPLLPRLYLAVFPSVRDSFPLVLAASFGLAGSALLAPAVLMGLSLPLLVRLGASRSQRRYQRLGEIYAANTVGSIVASAGTGLALLPWLGVENSIRLAIGVNLLAAAVGLAGADARIRRALALALAVVLGLALAIPPWREQVMVSGPAIYASVLEKAGIAAPEAPGDVLFYRDGSDSTVSVHRAGEILYLRVNGKTDASTVRTDMATQSMLGHLPMLAHPQARRALVIGLGSGITGGAFTLYPGLDHLDVAEIEPAMVQAAEYFAPWNREVLKNPKVHLRLNDGRNVLMESAPYDVLSIEPSNPWISGIASLYTREFYEVCQDRLTPDGILCQWIHLRALQEEDLKMVIATFAEVFPRGQVWMGAAKDLLLLGWKGEGPASRMPQRLEDVWRQMPEVRADLQAMGVATPLAFYGRYVCDLEDLRSWRAGARLNTDDLPLLEYRAPRNLYRSEQDLGLRRALMQYRRGLLPAGTGLQSQERNLAPLMAETARANRDPELEAWLLEQASDLSK
jgi:spermidine synthase